MAPDRADSECPIVQIHGPGTSFSPDNDAVSTRLLPSAVAAGTAEPSATVDARASMIAASRAGCFSLIADIESPSLANTDAFLTSSMLTQHFAAMTEPTVG